MKLLKDLIGPKFIPGIRLRYADWNHRIRYFSVSEVRDNNAYGTLDSGERMTFSLESDFWIPYFEGDEDCARAI